MELKRALTKRMRIRKNAPPNSIDLPPAQLQDSTASGPTAPPMTPVTPVVPQTTPATPTTPSTEEFASFAFEDQPESPQRLGRVASTRSSRSGSVASGHAHQLAQPGLASAHMSLHAPVHSSPVASSAASSVPTVEPMSPASMHGVSDSDADEMAQQILDTVQRGGEKWSL